MQIHFTKQFPWESPTNFKQKIWSGLIKNDLSNQVEMAMYSHHSKTDDFLNYKDFKPKIHTIREDVHNRWKKDRVIDFVEWTNAPYRSKTNKFAPRIPCTGVQNFEIKWSDGLPIIFIDGIAIVDFEGSKELETLAHNDGFESVELFLKWFDSDFKGRIIGWTNFRYYG